MRLTGKAVRDTAVNANTASDDRGMIEKVKLPFSQSLPTTTLKVQICKNEQEQNSKRNKYNKRLNREIPNNHVEVGRTDEKSELANGRRKRHAREKARVQFIEETRSSADGVICILYATHYLVEGTIGTSRDTMRTSQFAFDTGAGLNIIRRSALPEGWEEGIDRKANSMRLNDANGRPLALGESTWLPIRFANSLYRVKFIVADRLAVEVIIGTAFLNRHLLAILCTQQRIRFRDGEMAIFKQIYVS